MKKVCSWASKLFTEPDEEGIERPSLRRVAFGYSMLVATYIVVVSVWFPHLLTEPTVKIVEQMMWIVAFVHGGPGVINAAGGVIDAIARLKRGERRFGAGVFANPKAL
jgi:hypothetical protein